jgi:ferritin-like metal-binding protein YciE
MTDLTDQVATYLGDALAMEEQSIELLEKAVGIAGDPYLAQLYRGHLNESREHRRYVEERLEALGRGPSRLKGLAGKAAAAGLGIAAQAMPDTPGRLAAAAFAFEHFEIASYELLRTSAERAGDGETVELCERIIPVERQAAQLIERNLPLAAERSIGAGAAA